MPTHTEGDGDTDAATTDAPTLTACTTSPERTVLLESGNTDGWIASDLTVDAEEFR
ncbi:MAG: hypothetical protein J07HB67_02105 [halophilic archaeon J07HB67]|nr:MAG: hypothetical protein J07HB67_02105 [halophilic archaeon J07HB67]